MVSLGEFINQNEFARPRRTAHTLTSGVDARMRQPVDSWQLGLGMGAESDIAAELDLQDARRTFRQGGVYRTPDGRITNVNLGGEQILAEPTGMPERYASGGSFQTFTHGNELSRQLEEADDEEGAPNFDLINPYKLPEDSDLRRRIERVRESGGLPNYRLRRKLAQEYEAATGEDLTARRLGVAKLEKELEPAPVDFTKTPQGVQYQEQMKNFRERMKEEGLTDRKTLDALEKGTLSAEDFGNLWKAQAEVVNDMTFTIPDPDNPGEFRMPTAGERQLIINERVNQILEAYNKRYGFGGPGLGGRGGGVQVQGEGVVNTGNLPELNPNDTASVQAYGNALYAQNPWLTQDEVRARVAEDMKKASGKNRQVAGGIKQPEPKEEKAEATPSPDEMGIMNPDLAGGAGLSPYERAYPETGRGLGPVMDVVEPAARGLRGALGGGGFLGGRPIQDPAQALEMVRETHGDELADEFWNQWEQRRINRGWDAPPVEEEIKQILAGMGIYV